MDSAKNQRKSTWLVALAIIVVAAFAVAIVAISPSFAASTKANKSSSTTSDSANSAATGNGSVKGYDADSDLQYGTVVQLDKKNNQKVLAVNQKDAQQMYGVVVDPQLLSLTFSNPSFSHEAYVATSGNYDVFVSDQNGSVEAGDYLEISSIDGVTMDAGKQGVPVLGRALASFDSKKNVLFSSELKTSSGQALKQVSVGIIPVAINIQRNPAESSTKVKSPNFLQQVGHQLADKPITPAQLYLGASIAVVSLIIAVVILYSGVRNSVISLGRNPLSRKTIIRGLIEVVLAALIILVIGFFTIYLILKI